MILRNAPSDEPLGESTTANADNASQLQPDVRSGVPVATWNTPQDGTRTSITNIHKLGAEEFEWGH